jgi:NAD(P)H-hydrate epimerase
MGNNQNTKEAVKRLLSVCNLPTVIDADGLNCVADDLDILKSTVAQVIVTPHPGEMARLIKKDISWVEKNRVSCAKEFSKEYGVITVLKGAYTVIATPSGKCFINTTGCQGMATAGSGDMLSGMISAFLANGTDPVLAAVSAVCLHGAAGEKTASKLGVRGMIVSDMIDQLPFVLN